MRSRCLIVVLAVFGLAGITAAAQATVIDDFSGDSSGKYNMVTSYNGGGWAAYGIDNGQFAPTGGGNSTDWLRNDGPQFGVGSSVSIEVASVPVVDQAAGLSFSKSLTENAHDFAYFLQYRPYVGGMTFNTNTVIPDFDSSFAYGTAKVTVTRTGQTSLGYAIDYYKIDGSLAQFAGTDTIASGDYYFGMFSYNCGGARWDNLSYTTVPEPSVIALAASGLIGLLAYAWRKRK